MGPWFVVGHTVLYWGQKCLLARAEGIGSVSLSFSNSYKPRLNPGGRVYPGICYMLWGWLNVTVPARCPACCGGCCTSPCLTDEACDDTIIFLIGTTAKNQSLRVSSQPVWLQSISHQKTQTYVYLQIFGEESWRRC